MTRLLAALLGATIFPALLTAQAGPPPSSPMAALVPDTVLAPPGGPRIVLLTAPGEGVAALRLAVPLREGTVEAGAGWLLKELGLERMETLARPVGAQVTAARTPWGIAYSVVGAAADFEYLAYLLREAVAAPAVDSPSFQEAHRRLAEAASAAEETPGGRVAEELRSKAAPGVPPTEGTAASVRGIDGGRIREVWLRSHQPGRMTLVVSAPVIPEVVLAATRGMGAPESSAGAPLDAPSPASARRPPPQALRTWYGEAWYGSRPQDPRGPVAARLVAQVLRPHVEDFEASVALWELPDRWVLAVVGAAYGTRVSVMRRVVSSALTEARDGLDPRSVDDAMAEVRRDILLRSRTPAGLVSLVGRAMEADGDPAAAAGYLQALTELDVVQLRAFLDELLTRGPVRGEVRP